MKIELIPEPELEFGAGSHIDIRFGLKNYGPATLDVATAPKQIRVGFVGTQKSIEGVKKWMKEAGGGLPAKESRKSNFFPPFPGFGSDSCFQCSWITEERLQRAIGSRDIARLITSTNKPDGVRQAVEIFMTECRYLTQITNTDVLICAPPTELLSHLDSNSAHDEDDDGKELSSEAHESENQTELDFHDLLKAKSLTLRSPIQFIRPYTYDEDSKETLRTGRKRGKQDSATRAWNFFTALYYKAGGTPWRLRRHSSDYDSCYVGVSFYHTIDGQRVHSSVAQVFNERGEGMILRGGDAPVSKEDRQPHLKQNDMKALLLNVLTEFEREHHHPPARVVFHKTSSFNEQEMAGCHAAFDELRIKTRDLLVIRKSSFRLFRSGAFPPLRGSLIELDARRHVLYTRGSVPFFQMYPGMYIPRGLELELIETDSSPRQLAEEVLALTKMNWNNTQFDSALPITLRAARHVGGILKYTADLPTVASNYAFYM
ncbi:MAG: hypothetical protein QOI07_2020 [Verrucomicrobiota bacterium]|jgi:hypothetical protein